MATDFSTYSAIQTALFCRVDVEDYDILRFSSYNRPVTINSEVYQPLGQLLSVTETSSTLRATSTDLTIAISGIPNASIAEFVDNKIRGSAVQVWRLVFDATTGAELSGVGNPIGRFQGTVNNFSIQEEYDYAAQTSTVSIVMTCSSVVDTLYNKYSGRRTNPTDQQLLYPTDNSMNRVLKLSKANLNWGAPG